MLDSEAEPSTTDPASTQDRDVPPRDLTARQAMSPPDMTDRPQADDQR
jgi:hypothetical protein